MVGESSVVLFALGQPRGRAERATTNLAFDADVAAPATPAAVAPGMAPKPNLGIAGTGVRVVTPTEVFWPTSLGFTLILASTFRTSKARFALSSSSSRCLSYPSRLIRSASSNALRSASAKSIFWDALVAPSPPSFLVFAVVVLVLVLVVAFSREAPSRPTRAEDAFEEEARREDELTVRGEGSGCEGTGGEGLAMRPGDGVLPRTGGVGAGDAGLGVDGLLHEVKKSS